MTLNLDELKRLCAEAKQSYMTRVQQRYAKRRLEFAAAEALPELIVEVERLREVLQAMVDAEVEYMTINNLGDPEKQHNVKWARAALKGTPS